MCVILWCCVDEGVEQSFQRAAREGVTLFGLISP
jgi:hypothetical protein